MVGVDRRKIKRQNFNKQELPFDRLEGIEQETEENMTETKEYSSFGNKQLKINR